MKKKEEIEKRIKFLDKHIEECMEHCLMHKGLMSIGEMRALRWVLEVLISPVKGE